MNALRFVSFSLLLLEISVVFGELTSPQNLTLQTLNTNYVLKWDWHQETAMNESVTFTAQYLAHHKVRKPAHKQDWKSVCVNVSEHHCDFSNAGLHYLGMFLLRVKANTAQQSSHWVQIEFCPDKHAALGPPSSVKVNSVKEGLEIMISDPLSSTNQSMKELVQNMNYLIQYWKQSDDIQKANVLPTESNVVMLSELERWTWYCVRVQSYCEFYNKSSVYSPTYCTQTGGETPYWLIFLYFLLSVVLLLLLLLLLFSSYKMYKIIKSIFYPTIPAYIQECWSPQSNMPYLLTPETESVCDRLSITHVKRNSAVVVMNVHISPEDLQDTGTHSRYGSEDSGVYSTEDGSGQKQWSSTQEITCTEVEVKNMYKQKREPMHGGIQGLCG